MTSGALYPMEISKVKYLQPTTKKTCHWSQAIHYTPLNSWVVLVLTWIDGFSFLHYFPHSMDHVQPVSFLRWMVKYQQKFQRQFLSTVFETFVFEGFWHNFTLSLSLSLSRCKVTCRPAVRVKYRSVVAWHRSCGGLSGVNGTRRANIRMRDGVRQSWSDPRAHYHRSAALGWSEFKTQLFHGGGANQHFSISNSDACFGDGLFSKALCCCCSTIVFIYS